MRLLVILLPLTLTGCSDLPSGPDHAGLQVAVEEVSCTEAWLRVSNPSGPRGSTISLARDGRDTRRFQLVSRDTLIYDQGLLPRHAYTYQAMRLEAGRPMMASPPVSATTADTTSHAFSWTLEYFGGVGLCTLYDVAVLSDSLAYAAGIVSGQDSLGNKGTYNFLRWNGSSWTRLQIGFWTICGQSSITPYPAASVLALNSTDIWIGVQGDQVARFNGSAQTATMCLPVSGYINRLWGIDRNSIYAVDHRGGVTRYDGAAWRREESGTALPLTDVYGTTDARQVWAVGYSQSTLATVLLNRRPGGPWQIAYDDAGAGTAIRSDSLSGPLVSGAQWSKHTSYVLSASGLYCIHDYDALPKARRLSFTSTYFPGFPFRVTGTGNNDITIVGAYCFVAHYNGMTWRYYDELRNLDIVLLSAACTKSTVIAVGFLYDPVNSLGVILTGRRMN